MTKRTSVTSDPGTAANGRVALTTATGKTMRELRSTTPQAMLHVPAGGEPILWLSTQDRNWKGNHRKGRERLPSVAHSGDYHVRSVDERTRGRFRRMLRHDGHVVSQVHTNGAAHVTTIAEGKWSADGYTAYALGKAQAFGWIDLDGGCLVRQVKAGLVDARTLVAEHGNVQCKGDTCRHIDAERDARRARHNAAEDKRDAKMRRRDPAVEIARGVAAALRELEQERGK